MVKVSENRLLRNIIERIKIKQRAKGYACVVIIKKKKIKETIKEKQIK